MCLEIPPNPSPDREVRVLPDAAHTHFEYLCSDEFVSASRQFANAQLEFDRRENQRGGGRGNGYAARLAGLYQREFQRRSKFILSTLRAVHESFGKATGEVVESQLKDLGARMIGQQFQALEGSYLRHVQPFGLESCSSGLSDIYPLEAAAIQNSLARHFWTLRNVPMATESPIQPTMNFYGQVGAVQTGPNAVANVTQQWTQDNVNAVLDALSRLRRDLTAAPSVEHELRAELVQDMDRAAAELKAGAPSPARILRWLGGVAAAVQTIPAVKPAWEAVRDTARALGLPL